MDIEFLRSLGHVGQVAQYLKVNGYDQGAIDAVLRELEASPAVNNEESQTTTSETTNTE